MMHETSLNPPQQASAPRRRAETAPRWFMPVVRRYRRVMRARKVARIRIFFICGHPKSGTHWVANLVNLHPEVLCRGELQLQSIRRAILDLRGNAVYQVGKRMRPTIELHFARMVRECLVTFNRDRPGACVLGDHSPLPLMDMVSDPTVRYLHITRDGRDVAVSFTFHWLRARKPQWVPDHLREQYLNARRSLDGSRERATEAAKSLLSSELWVKHVASLWANRVGQDRATLASDDSDVRHRTLLIRYERLHADVEGERNRMYKFLGVDPDLAAPPSVETKTVAGFTTNDPRSLYRKGESGDWRSYFEIQQRGWLDEALGTELIELGYESDHSWVGRDDVVVRKNEPSHRGTVFATTMNLNL